VNDCKGGIFAVSRPVAALRFALTSLGALHMPTKFYHRTALAMAIAACFPAAVHAAGVARVDFAVGNVIAQDADGRTRPLAKGSQIEVGDTINTRQGRAQLRFEDGAFMSLQPETAFKVEQFRFTENGAGDDNIVMNLLRGGMRTITGLIGRANKRNYKFRTEVATIGIRGTEYAVRYTNSIDVFCAGGSIEVENEGGTLVLGPGQGGFVQSPKQEPRRSDERPFLPPTTASGGQEPQEEVSQPVNPVQEATTVVAGKSAWAAARLTSVNTDVGSITSDSATGLQAFDDSRGTNLLNTSTAVLDGTDGIISWGRWINGVTGGTGLYSGLDTRSAPLHWVAGLPTAVMPTGSATYSMIGATTPSCAPSCSAALNSSSLSVNFGAGTASLNINITVNGFDNYAGAVPLSLSGSSFSGSGALTSACTSGSLLAKGFFAGDAAARAGLAYHLGTTFPSTQNVNGAVAYSR
jgi:hypothetical protein